MRRERKLPIGIQTFEKIREEGFLYVDKTALVYQMASTSILLKQSDYDLRLLVHGVEVDQSAFAEYRAETRNPLPMIYQSGYLTIKDYDKEVNLYTLGFPNDEVRYGFLKFLVPYYTEVTNDETGFHIAKFMRELRAGDVDAFMERNYFK